MLKSMSIAALLRAALAAIMFSALAAAAAEDPKASQAKTAKSAPARTASIPLNSGTPDEFASDPHKITLERLPNGTRLYHMNGQGKESISAHIGKDGKLEYTCTDAGDKVLQDAAAGHAHGEPAREEHAHEE